MCKTWKQKVKPQNIHPQQLLPCSEHVKYKYNMNIIENRTVNIDTISCNIVSNFIYTGGVWLQLATQ